MKFIDEDGVQHEFNCGSEHFAELRDLLEKVGQVPGEEELIATCIEDEPELFSSDSQKRQLRRMVRLAFLLTANWDKIKAVFGLEDKDSLAFSAFIGGAFLEYDLDICQKVDDLLRETEQ